VRNDESCLRDMINCVCGFVSDAGFRGRVIYVQICHALISTGYSKVDFEKYFLNGLEKLSLDNVVNVRIALGRLVGELGQLEQYYQDSTTHPSQITSLINKLAGDSEVDLMDVSEDNDSNSGEDQSSLFNENIAHDLLEFETEKGIVKDPTSLTFGISGEDHTLGNALRYVITLNPEVEYCGYSIPHPSEDKLNIRIQTT
ncbi:32667_t:CDS:2, partial [Racocetra persica]